MRLLCCNWEEARAIPTFISNRHSGSSSLPSYFFKKKWLVSRPAPLMPSGHLSKHNYSLMSLPMIWMENLCSLDRRIWAR